MKNIILILLASVFIYSCSKDDISRKDRKDDCKNCILETYRNDTLIATFTYTNFTTYLGTSDQWCNYCDTINKGPLLYNGQYITRKIKCN